MQLPKLLLLYLLFNDKINLSASDGFEFNYHQLAIGPGCITIAWNYSNGRCSPPVMFALQGFELDQITSNQLASPRFQHNSTSLIFTLIKSRVLEDSLHYRVIGLNSNGEMCDTTLYYNFTLLLSNASCHNQTMANTSQSCLTSQDRKNLTFVFSESTSLLLYINLTREPSTLQPQHLAWEYNGQPIIIHQSSRFSLGARGGLIINGAEPEDAGCYVAVVLASHSCTNLHFQVFIEFLNISEPSTVVEVNEEVTNITFSCSASGYPNAHLISWQAATGDSLTGNNATNSQHYVQYTRTRNMYASSLSTTLSISSESLCWQARGFICTFSNEASPPITESVYIPCPPGPPSTPSVNFFSDNNTLCFSANSSIDFPVENYLVNISYTISSGDELATESWNTSHCINLNSESYPSVCEPLFITTIATNSFSNSRMLHYNFSFEDQSSCQNSSSEILYFLFQVRLEGVPSCENWIDTEIGLKQKALISILIQSINMECGCSFPTSHINQSKFMCLRNNPNYVTFRAKVFMYLNFTISILTATLNSWAKSQESVSILGQELRIDNDFSVEITRQSNDVESVPTMMTNYNTIAALAGSISAVFVIVLTTIFVSLASFAAYRKCKRVKKETEENNPNYAEVAELKSEQRPLEVPVYEEILPKEPNTMSHYTTCEAYNIMHFIKCEESATLRNAKLNEVEIFDQCLAYGTLQTES